MRVFQAVHAETQKYLRNGRYADTVIVSDEDFECLKGELGSLMSPRQYHCTGCVCPPPPPVTRVTLNMPCGPVEVIAASSVKLEVVEARPKK